MPNCLTCETEFSFVSRNPKKKFCNNSCAAIYNNTGQVRSKVASVVTTNCEGCNKVIVIRGNTLRNYCSNSCQREHIWKTVDRLKVEAGEGKRATCVRYLIEVYGELCATCKLPPIWNNAPLTLQLDHNKRKLTTL